MENVNMVITGSNGFLGSSLLNYLKKNNNTLKIFESSKNKKKLQDKFYFNLHEDFDKSFLIRNKISLIIHTAFSFNFYSLEEGLKKNRIVSQKLFTFAKNNNIDIIYISSISAFDQAKSNYGKIKLLIEKDAKENNIVVLRPGLIYSKNNPGGMFGKLLKVIYYLPIIPLINGGKNKQFMCNIFNLCDLINNIILNKNFNHKIIYAFNEKSITLKEMLNRLMLVFNKKRIFIHIPSSIILIILKFFELFYFNFGIKSDSLVSFLNSAKFKNIEHNEYNIVFNDFREDFKINT